MSATTLAPSVRAACERWADRPAITYRGQTLSYADFWKAVGALASAYTGLGVGNGERIVCQLPTRPEHLVAASAAWACGAVHVGADKDLAPPELASLVTRTEAAAVIVQPPDATDPLAYGRALREASSPTVTIGHDTPVQAGHPTLAELLAGPAPEAFPSGPEGGTALLFLTSGTTGKPKAVMETLPALWAKMQFFADAYRPGPDDGHVMYLPLSHAFGLKLSLTALCSGGRLVMLDRFSPDEALRLASDEHASILPGTPAHFAMLVDALDQRHDLSRLRWAITAAAPLPRPLLQRLYEDLGVELFHVYGCSEGFLTATTNRNELARGSVGRNVFRGPHHTPPDGKVAVFDPETHDPLPAGELGEIAYGARHPVRYWKEPPAATDGWYRTGDLGFLDTDGCLFVRGRLKDVVNRGGLKVVPGEVEGPLSEHPAVADCAVIPTPDPVLGEAVCACVVPGHGPVPALRDLRSFLAPAVARHKLPDELCVLDALPRTRGGKLDRQALVRRVVEAAVPRERLRPSMAGG